MVIITLTSDFGNRDYLAGAFKGRILSSFPSSQLVDISHEVAISNYSEAAYIISNSVFHFPAHSFHILLVNLFDSEKAAPILALHKDHYFATADNGLLPMVLGSQPEHCVELPFDKNRKYDPLHWADVFGKAISNLENGQSLHQLGEEPDKLEEKMTILPNFGPNFIEGRIIFIDRFENVVVNITREQFSRIGKNRKFLISFKSRDSISKISEGYPQVNEGSSLAFFNAAGYLEISVNKGNAASLFGLQTFSHMANPEFIKSRMFYQTVRILFEEN